MIFVALDVLNVKLQNVFESQGQQSSDQRSWVSNRKLVVLA
jgi:hypothetical protein